MNKRFIITENDKRHILSMYNLITEAPETATSTQFKNNFRFEYNAGYWSVGNPKNASGGKTVKTQIDDFAKEFVTWYQGLQSQKFPIGEIKIVLTASESKIPNTDQEAGGGKIGEGELSKKRLGSLQEYLSSLFANYKNIVFESKNLGSQGENYTGKNKEELKKYQYVTISVDAVATIACNGELSIQGQKQSAPDFKYTFPFAADPNAQGYKFVCNALTIPDRFANSNSFRSNTTDNNLKTLFSLLLGKVYSKYPGSAAFNGVEVTENADEFLKTFYSTFNQGGYNDSLAKLKDLITESGIKEVFTADQTDMANSFIKGELVMGGSFTINNLTGWAKQFLIPSIIDGVEFSKIPNIDTLKKNYTTSTGVDLAEKSYDRLKSSNINWETIDDSNMFEKIQRLLAGSQEIKNGLTTELSKGLKNIFKYSVKIDQGPVTVSLSENKLDVFAPLSNTVFKVKRICI
jgi:hypothetical protein